jgi:hypothetical protein
VRTQLKLKGLAVAAAAAVLLASCSSGDDPTPSAISSVNPTPGSTAVVTPSKSSTPVTSSLSTAASPTLTPTPTPTTNPWPATFTPDQANDATAALDVFRAAVKLQDEVSQNPGMPDIHSFLRPAIVDPWSSQVEMGAQSMVTGGRHATGYTVIADSEVTTYEANRISITACLDSSGVDVLDSTGQSVKAVLPVGNRVLTTANVYLYPAETPGGGGWFLSEVQTPQPYEPC